MSLIPRGGFNISTDYVVKKAVNWGSNWLNNKINFGLNYLENWIRQYDIFGILPDQWSVIDDTGERAFPFDSFVTADTSAECKVIQAPVEGGSFVSYNMVVPPVEIKCTLARRGYPPELMAFVTALHGYVESTDLLSVITPDREFDNMKLTKMSYRRSADNGTDIIYADLSFVEVREVASQYTNARVAQKQSRGVQQAPNQSIVDMGLGKYREIRRNL